MRVCTTKSTFCIATHQNYWHHHFRFHKSSLKSLMKMCQGQMVR